MSKKVSRKFKLFFGFLAGAAFFSFASSSLAFTPGEIKTFNISPVYDSAGRSQIKATLRFVGDKAVFYIDDDYWEKSPDQKIITETAFGLLTEFDQTIYPRLTKIFGSEWSPGIDNELRIIVLLFKMKDNAGGYFDSADEFPKSLLPLSNESELIYLNASFLNTPKIKVYLAHEFQHLISFYQKEKLRNAVDDIWLNEARSEYTSTLLGYDDNFAGSNLEKRTKEFLQNSSDSLTEWQNENTDYGPVNLFMQYLASRYGQGILGKILKNELAGVSSINQAMAESGFSEKFNDIFLNWNLANFSNNCLLGEGQKYCYFNSNLSNFKISPILTHLLPDKEGFSFSFSDKIKDWSGHGYKISGGGQNLNLNLEFSGDLDANFQVPIIIKDKDDKESLRFLKIDGKDGAKETFSGFGSQIKSVVLAPFSQSKTSGFSANEPVHSFSYTASLVDSSILTPTPSPFPVDTNIMPAAPSPTPLPSYQDGSLIRAKNDFKVYVLKDKFKRWLQAPEILAAYPHFSWQNIAEASPLEQNWYKDAWLVRAAGDYKIFEINGDGTKHWLNMSAENFSKSGRDWGMVYEINKKELEWYKKGADVIL